MKKLDRKLIERWEKLDRKLIERWEKQLKKDGLEVLDEEYKATNIKGEVREYLYIKPEPAKHFSSYYVRAEEFLNGYNFKKWKTIWEMHSKGLSERKIAKKVHKSQRTVNRRIQFLKKEMRDWLKAQDQIKDKKQKVSEIREVTLLDFVDKEKFRKRPIEKKQERNKFWDTEKVPKKEKDQWKVLTKEEIDLLNKKGKK